MILQLLQIDGLGPKRKGHGDEWASPCPACGGDDRFILHTDTGRYWCRQCGAKGDAIQYLRDFHGMGYREAAEAVGKDVACLPSKRSAVIRLQPPKPTPTIDREAWRSEAAKIISSARQELGRQHSVLRWMEKERGITRQTAERFSLGYITTNQYHDRAIWGLPEETREDGTPKKLFIPAGLVIPGPDRVRIRRDNPGEYGRYHVLPGSGAASVEIGRPHETTAVIVESELDAILLSQEVSRDLFIVALGSTNIAESYKAKLLEKLTDSPVVLIAFDSDRAGAEASVQWLSDLHNAFRAPVPVEYGKDITEAHCKGLNLNAWLSACLELYAESITDCQTVNCSQQFPEPPEPPEPMPQ